MKKTLSILLLVVFMLQLSNLSVLALDVIITNSGDIQFYSAGQVLGREDDREEREEKGEDEDREDRHEEEREVEREDEKPERVVPKSSDSRLRIEADKDKVELHLEDREDKTGFRSGERSKVNTLQLEAPSQLKTEAEDRVRENEEETEGEKAREERRERVEEKIEVRSQRSEDGTTEFEFESRDVKAKVKNVEFILDPETNEVTLVTPSGEEKVLSHLPDQAIEQMKAAGFFDALPDDLPEDGVELELETREDGTVVYSTVVEKEEKLLGFFTRTYETKIEFDDETGEITEERLPRRSLLGRLLSF